MKILSALEKLEDQSGSAPQNVDELDEVMLAVMEDEQEIADETDALEEMDDELEGAEDAIERLEGLKMAIEQYGICKPMMAAFDPQGELSAAGIVPATEELDDVPVKDEDAETAVEGIGQTIKDAWKKLVDFLKRIVAKLKSWIGAVMRGFKSYETALIATIKKLNSANVDTKKLSEADAKVVTKAEFNKIVFAAKALIAGTNTKFQGKLSPNVDKETFSAEDADKVVGEAEKAYASLITADVTDASGLEVKDGSVVSGKAKIERKSMKVGKDGGWDESSIDAALKNSLKLIQEGKKGEKAMNDAIKANDDHVKLVTKQLSVVDKLDAKEVTRRTKIINAIKKVNTAERMTVQSGIMLSQKAASIAMALGKAAIKSKTD